MKIYILSTTKPKLALNHDVTYGKLMLYFIPIEGLDKTRRLLLAPQ